MRKKLIAGNWKMNGLKADGLALADDIASLYGHGNALFDVLICPPFTLLNDVYDRIKESNVWLGGQDCSSFEKGAHTGDVSPQMLRDVGCNFVILGHSERRQNHYETNEVVCQKAYSALNAGLKTIICVGETLEQKDKGETLKVIEKQIQQSLPEKTSADKVIIAYEPVWAIGTGKVATVEEIKEVHAFIRQTIKTLFGEDVAEKMLILYGGSVKPTNAKEILALDDVDGALVGGASLTPHDFWGIATAVKGEF